MHQRRRIGKWADKVPTVGKEVGSEAQRPLDPLEDVRQFLLQIHWMCQRMRKQFFCVNPGDFRNALQDERRFSDPLDPPEDASVMPVSLFGSWIRWADIEAPSLCRA